MDSRIQYLEESYDSCSIRLDKAKAAIAIQKLEIDNLRAVDRNSLVILSEKDKAIMQLHEDNLHLSKSVKVLKGFAIAAPIVGFALGFALGL